MTAMVHTGTKLHMITQNESDCSVLSMTPQQSGIILYVGHKIYKNTQNFRKFNSNWMKIENEFYHKTFFEKEKKKKKSKLKQNQT